MIAENFIIIVLNVQDLEYVLMIIEILIVIHVVNIGFEEYLIFRVIIVKGEQEKV